MNLDAALLDRARAQAGDGGPWTLADTLVELGTPRVDAHSLTQDVHRRQGLGPDRGAGSRRRHGRRSWVVGFHRAQSGDFLQLRRPTGPGCAHVTIAPTSAKACWPR